MDASVMHKYGNDEDYQGEEMLERLYDELAEQDDEHPDVSATSSGWSISAYRSGLVIRFDLSIPPDDASGTTHMINIDRSGVLRLWKLLVNGDVASIAREPWRPGYRPS